MKKSFLRLMAVLGCSAMMMVACHSEKKVTTAPAPVNQPDTVVGVTIAVPITMEVKSAVSSNMKTQQKELIHALEIISYATDTEKDTMVTVEIIPDPNKLDAIKLGLNDSVLFKFNSAEINPKAEPVLNELAKKLNSFPETFLTMVGYASHTGNKQYNYELSVRRADAIMNYFKSKGISTKRMKAIGKGWADPVASNATPAGRYKNQRVVIWVTADENMVKKATKAAKK